MCGIVGIAGQHEAAPELYECLIQLQHRGQDAAGIVTCDDRIHIKRGKGLVREVFSASDMDKLTGTMGIAHARYPTAGGFSDDEVQPFFLGNPYGIALAHNGHLVNHDELRHELREVRRRYLNTDSDSEALIHLLASDLDKAPQVDDSAAFFEQLCQAVQDIFSVAKGSYSVVCNIIGKGMLVFRDPHGIRPLTMGKRQHGDRQEYIFASENTALFSLGYERDGDVLPGEVIFVDLQGQLFRRQLTQETFRPCVFEYVYFARPDAHLDDVSVYRARLRMGQNLAMQWQAQFPDEQPDVVVPVPFTSNTAALSFANQLGVRYSEGLYKNPFIGRTFIMANQGKRQRSVRRKLSPQMTELKDKNVLLLDDSIVRGTTSREIVRMVKECGANKVYFVSACPPVKHPCFYGIDIPTSDELIGAKMSVDEIKDYLGVDGLLYQSLDDLTEAVTRKGEHHGANPCMACLNGQYFCGKDDKAVITRSA